MNLYEHRIQWVLIQRGLRYNFAESYGHALLWSKGWSLTRLASVLARLCPQAIVFEWEGHDSNPHTIEQFTALWELGKCLPAHEYQDAHPYYYGEVEYKEANGDLDRIKCQICGNEYDTEPHARHILNQIIRTSNRTLKLKEQEEAKQRRREQREAEAEQLRLKRNAKAKATRQEAARLRQARIEAEAVAAQSYLLRCSTGGVVSVGWHDCISFATPSLVQAEGYQ